MYSCICHCTHKSRDTDSLPAVRPIQGCSFGCFISAFALNDACMCRLCIQMAVDGHGSRGLFVWCRILPYTPGSSPRRLVKSKCYVFMLHWQCPVSSSAIHCPPMPANWALRSFCCRLSIRLYLKLNMFQAQDFDWFERVCVIWECWITSSICCLVLACRVLKRCIICLWT